MSENKFTWESSVRDYELDSLGMVNNATYVNYLEECRNRAARSLGVDFLEYYEAGYSLVVARLDIKYRVALRSKDEFFVTAELAKFDDKRMCFDQEIILKKNKAVATRATVYIACVDHKTGRACMPDILKQSLPAEKYS